MGSSALEILNRTFRPTFYRPCKILNGKPVDLFSLTPPLSIPLAVFVIIVLTFCDEDKALSLGDLYFRLYTYFLSSYELKGLKSVLLYTHVKNIP
jgi:hypothetical protein